MKLAVIRIGRRYNLGNYEHVEIGIEAVFDSDTTLDDAIAQATQKGKDALAQLKAQFI